MRESRAFYAVTLVKSQLYELTTVTSRALVMAVGILLAAGGVRGSGASAKDRIVILVGILLGYLMRQMSVSALQSLLFGAASK